MQKIIKALKDAQAVLAEYITPKEPQVPARAPVESAGYWRTRCEDAESAINALLGILDNRELVEHQRACEIISGNNEFTAAVRTLEYLDYTYSPGAELWKPPVFPTVKPVSMASADPNVESVRKMLLDRSALGFKKYGVGTNRDDLQLADWLQHLQEELCDAVVYIQAAKTGPNPHATELKEARKERERALKALQDAAEREMAHAANARLLHKANAENAALRARLQRITDALNGAK